jgi:SAM-dependent methyltransferase
MSTAPGIRLWAALSGGLAVALALAAYHLRWNPHVPDYERAAGPVLLWVAAVLLALALAATLSGLRPVAALVSRGLGAAEVAAPRRHPYLTLFIISFVALFVELMLIRYCGSQIRIFSFYKNVPLIASFLGLGLGCWLARGTPRHVLAFLLWLVPFAAFLSGGSLVVSNLLGKQAALASTEHIHGDFHPGAVAAGEQAASQLLMVAFAVATLVVITRLFVLLGRVLGEAFGDVERLAGYTVNIVGSLAGILAFIGLSYLESPPWVWFAVGLTPLVWWAPGRYGVPLALGLIAANVAVVYPAHGETVWSRYQKLVGHHVTLPGSSATAPRAYFVEISDVFYQVAIDRRPEARASAGVDFLPHYDAVYAAIPRPARVLIVGSGTGNDVAAALRAGAGRVDAVDIDPAILAMGRRHHPERPYDDPRVRLIVDDARHAFRQQPPGAYDAVVFGLLDSHTQLGVSSVRLDNYVFTQESFEEARRLVRPGGHLIITAAMYRSWLRDRLAAMLQATVHGPVDTLQHANWYTFVGRVGDDGAGPAGAAVSSLTVPTDDWPFLYLPSRHVPLGYLWTVAAMALVSILILRQEGLRLGAVTGVHGHFFFLGAAFLLMEIHAINRLALVFGTTWLVSAVTIAVVLLLIVGANASVYARPQLPYRVAYAGLGLSLVASYWLHPASVLGQGPGVALAFAVILISPIYFAGLVFARSFGSTALAAPALGANILGSVVGGWLEYSTMALGVRPLLLLAALLYGLSLLWVPGTRRLQRAGSRWSPSRPGLQHP